MPGAWKKGTGNVNPARLISQKIISMRQLQLTRCNESVACQSVKIVLK